MTTIETLTIAPAGTWRLDPVHSSVGFEVPYLAGTFKGQFDDVEAQLTVHEGEATLEGAARVASVDVKDENLAAHLQSPDFFDAERHPDLRFVARDLALDDGTVRVKGEITIRGVAKPVELTGTVTAPIADAYGKDRLGAAPLDDGRPHRVRPELEHAAAERGARPRRRRPHRGRPPAREGGIAR